MNVVFNCGDYFQDFCSYQAKVEVLRVCFFLFLIFAPCPIRCFTIPLDRGNGVYLGRGLISLFFYYTLDLKMILSIQTSNYMCIQMSTLITRFSYLIRNAMLTVQGQNNHAKRRRTGNSHTTLMPE
jgi:hypothetical protein